MPPLIRDLAVILATAGAVTLLFKRIGQPVVLGYLLAGFLVGPEVSFLPTVQEKEAIKTWAEIGVIVLLFGLGLEFSFKKLLAVGRGAAITAFTEILFMFGLGYITGQALNWNFMDSLFLGGILSISSTTIIIRALDELGLRQRRFVQLVFGVLIVEDLVAVLLLVLLSTIAVTHSFAGIQLLSSAAKLGFFLSIWFLGGIFIVPWFFRKTRHLMNEETFLIVALALCLIMVIFATHVGFSPALGAFIMGSILAETPDGERIEQALRSVRDLFAAIFFVSVGMLIEVAPLKEHWLAVGVITLITIGGKSLSTSLGALMGGQSIKTAVQSGMSLAQIGEFSFIIATLGLSLNVISDFLYPVAVAVSAFTTLSTPYMIRASEPFYVWLHQKLPDSLRNRSAEQLSRSVKNHERASFQDEILRLFLNSVAVVALALAFKLFVFEFLQTQFGSEKWATIISLGAALLLSLPSLWAIAAGAAVEKTRVYRFDDVRALTAQALLALSARIVLALFLLGFIVVQFASAILSMVLIVGAAVFIGFLGARNFTLVYKWLENRFLFHLNEKEMTESNMHIPPLVPWDVHLTKLEVSSESSLLGMRLFEIKVRERYGVTIAMIERGRKRIIAPRRDELLMSCDRLVVIGTEEQLAGFAHDLHPSVEGVNLGPSDSTHFGLYSLKVKGQSGFVGKTIRDSGLREMTDGIVVGIEREVARILNPDSSEILREDDLLWIVGSERKISALADEALA